ncbi:AmmeMemoRadiSam system protein B [Candidatus Woesearchaeota archaeon]|jgi:hypothetical protein|nr:AmmeMemoRadiSam system protein B [Candidatus Woesearchaeota archaeon]
MKTEWYPNKKEELKNYLNELFKNSEIRLKKLKNGSKNNSKKIYDLKGIYDKNIHGLIVPHAGYFFCGQVMADAFYFLKGINEKNLKKVIILGTNHYFYKKGIYTHNQYYLETPLGKINITKNNFEKIDIKKEHSINNQLPFLQYLGFKEILPLIINNFINEEDLKKIIEEFETLKEDYILICSTDLSHFLDYKKAKEKDIETIRRIKELNEEYFLKEENVACGFYPLLLTIKICKHFHYKPFLIDYKNSGNITQEKSSVVGYASFIF